MNSSLRRAIPLCRRRLSTLWPTTESRASSSSSSLYKIDHSGFLNALDGTAPLNRDLGLRDSIPNRNPRALEQMNISRRQEGWRFQAPNRKFCNKLVLDHSGRYVLASVVHKSGKTIIWASSQEPSLMKRLYSLQDIFAVKAVASVLARRCLKAGLHHVAVIEPPSVIKASDRLRAFHSVMESSGVSLVEPEVTPPPERHGVDYDAFDPYVYPADKSVIWPVSEEEYDPEIDILWENEGIERKLFPAPAATKEDYRPLVDPPPKDYRAALEKEEKKEQVEAEATTGKRILEIENTITFLE